MLRLLGRREGLLEGSGVGVIVEVDDQRGEFLGVYPGEGALDLVPRSTSPSGALIKVGLFASQEDGEEGALHARVAGSQDATLHIPRSQHLLSRHVPAHSECGSPERPR